MELKDYIAEVKSAYPNGYSDYLATGQTDEQGWYELHKSMEIVDVVEGETFDKNEVAVMSTWPNEKFWLFMGNVRYQFAKKAEEWK